MTVGTTHWYGKKIVLFVNKEMTIALTGINSEEVGVLQSEVAGVHLTEVHDGEEARGSPTWTSTPCSTS